MNQTVEIKKKEPWFLNFFNIFKFIIISTIIFIFLKYIYFYNYIPNKNNNFILYQEKIFTKFFSNGINCSYGLPCVYPEYKSFRIIILTYSRLNSLQVLLSSLEDLDTEGDEVSMEIWVDINKEGKVHKETIEFLKNYKWSKGLTRVHVQKEHAGIYGQWINSWRPRRYSGYHGDFDPKLKEELALILEDDMVVSPVAYKYLRMVHEKYKNRNDLAGLSLNTGDQFYFHNKRDTPKPKNKNIFLYMCIGTWGFVPNPFVWADFQDWYHNLLEKGRIPFIKSLPICSNSTNPSKPSTSCLSPGSKQPPVYHPYVAGTLPSVWYSSFEKGGKQDSMWEMWFIHFCHLYSKHTLYFNLNVLFNNSQEINEFIFSYKHDNKTHVTKQPITITNNKAKKKKDNIFIKMKNEFLKNSNPKPLTPTSQKENKLDFKVQSKMAAFQTHHLGNIFKNSPTYYLALVINRKERGLHFSGGNAGSNNVLISIWNEKFNFLPEKLSHFDWSGGFMYEN